VWGLPGGLSRPTRAEDYYHDAAKTAEEGQSFQAVDTGSPGDHIAAGVFATGHE